MAKLPSTTAAQSSNYASESIDFEDDFIGLDFDLGIEEFTTSSSMTITSPYYIDRGADKKQESSNTNSKRKCQSPVPVLDFDIGIEELLAAEFEIPPPRQVKRATVTPVAPRTPSKIQRTLSPPRHTDELRNLVHSVLGPSSPQQATLPPALMPLQPLANYEAQEQHEEEAPLERLSPCSFLRVTLQGQGHAD
ncbi:hypothetical protein B566_EDAN016217 [Ephemera danica]|nr:hypothetical protein B566_EDAN016217 [Ephemera danica]